MLRRENSNNSIKMKGGCGSDDSTFVSQPDPDQALVDNVFRVLEGSVREAVRNATKERYVIRHPQSGRVLHVKASGTANGTVVQLWEMNGTEAQVWTLDDSTGLITNPNSGKCLDAQGYDQNGSSSLAIMEPNKGGDHKSQAWQYTKDGMIVHAATGKALTHAMHDAVRLGARNAHGDLSQQWSLIPLSLFSK
jgi:Ricin-type beta-trefoil lectin domain